jgi:hypothetical protein
MRGWVDPRGVLVVSEKNLLVESGIYSETLFSHSFIVWVCSKILKGKLLMKTYLRVTIFEILK